MTIEAHRPLECDGQNYRPRVAAYGSVALEVLDSGISRAKRRVGKFGSEKWPLIGVMSSK
jgi:hypothetical protein